MHQIQIKAVPSLNGGCGNRNMKRLSSTDSYYLKGIRPPPRIPFEPTKKDKMCFKAITFMKVNAWKFNRKICTINGMLYYGPPITLQNAFENNKKCRCHSVCTHSSTQSVPPSALLSVEFVMTQTQFVYKIRKKIIENKMHSHIC